MPAPAASRKLAGIEQALRFIDAIAPFNVVMAVRIDGDFPAGNLGSALDGLQRRHPLLRARILTADGGDAFHFGGAGSIPVAETSGGDWIAVAEEELHRPFDLASGPLMRCRWLSDEWGGCLILTIHHTIVDGASAAHLIGELLAACAGQPNGGDGGASQEGEKPTAALYPAEYRGAGFARAAAAFVARQVADEVSFRWLSRGARKQPVHESGRCRILPARLPVELTAALLAASRRHRITLNAILGAALNNAVRRCLYSSEQAPLRHITFTNVRQHLRRSIPPSELGCHISMFRFTVAAGPEDDFWALARRIQDATLRSARSGERFLSDSMSPGLMKMMTGMKNSRMAATALSYNGPVNLPSAHGPFTVTGLHAFTTNYHLGPEYSVLAHLFRGEIWCDILYLDSDMDATQARAIAGEMQSLLETAAC